MSNALTRHVQGRIGIGSSGRFLVAQHIIDELIGGKELAEVIDQLSGKTDVRSSWVSTACLWCEVDSDTCHSGHDGRDHQWWTDTWHCLFARSVVRICTVHISAPVLGARCKYQRQINSPALTTTVLHLRGFYCSKIYVHYFKIERWGRVRVNHVLDAEQIHHAISEDKYALIACP